MLFTQMVYVGIDLTGRKAFTYAALDRDLKLLALAGGEMDDVLAFIGGQLSAYVAVNAPPRPNLGRVKSDASLPPLRHTGRGKDMRLAEHALRQRGIIVAATPSRQDLCPAWMRSGFSFYRKLDDLGFEPYPAGSASHQWLETHPQAAFIVLVGQRLLPASALEGRIQRQLVLFEQGLDIRDPMSFFEEITRHRLRQGILPLEQIYTPGQLNALVAAYTAYVAANQPEMVVSLGVVDEGQIVLPVGELKTKY
ncbi:MAG: DUF429 domain-containing protein [Chloroflexi bacterium]|nr:DUF429 domain-containing protein [Chloroflexota bacterium]